MSNHIILFGCAWRYIQLHSSGATHERDQGVSNHWKLECLLINFFRPTKKKTSNLCISGMESPGYRWILLKKCGISDNISISWRHHKSTSYRALLVTVVLVAVFPIVAVVVSAVSGVTSLVGTVLAARVSSPVLVPTITGRRGWVVGSWSRFNRCVNYDIDEWLHPLFGVGL